MSRTRDFHRLRRKMKDDIRRPIYHFLRPGGHLNDPHGLFFWAVRWHLFFKRAYPVRPDSIGVSLLARGGACVLGRLYFWTMRSIYPYGKE